jgi:hypothetical protein
MVTKVQELLRSREQSPAFELGLSKIPTSRAKNGDHSSRGLEHMILLIAEGADWVDAGGSQGGGKGGENRHR